MAASELAADTAASQHFYEDAVQFYEQALNTHAAQPADYARISEKLGYALFFGGDPDSANSWFERALTGYMARPETAQNAVTVLLRMARQLWLDSKTQAALPVISQAITVAGASKNIPAGRRANLAMAQYLVLLGRYNDAKPFSAAVEPLRDDDSSELRALYLDHQAIQAAALGEAEKALSLFERAKQISAEQPDPYLTTLVLDDQALWATALGELQLARRLREEALSVARQHHIAWRIPYFYLRSAAHVLNMGSLPAAWDLLTSALAYENLTPALLPLLAAVGIPLALHFDDDATLKRVALPAALDLAFLSGEEARAANAAAAFGELLAARGKWREAQAVLQRGVRHVQHADQCWDLLVAGARWGALDDAPRIRTLLNSRLQLPRPRVAQAHLRLCDAFWSQRCGENAKAQTLAAEAARQFETLSWGHRAKTANGLIEELCAIPGDDSARPGIAVLTPREREVAKLVAKSYSNRAIAASLKISEHTVESHMTSIMSRLHIRSRWQLIDAVRDSMM